MLGGSAADRGTPRSPGTDRSQPTARPTHLSLDKLDARPPTASGSGGGAAAALVPGRRASLGLTSFGGPILTYTRRPPSAAAISARTRAVQSLPPEIWGRILAYVPKRALVRVAGVSREMRVACWRPELWERFELEGVADRVPFRTVLVYLRRLAGPGRAGPREVDLSCARGPVGVRQDTARELLALLLAAERLVLPRFLVAPCLAEPAFAALPRLRALRLAPVGGSDELWIRGSARAHLPGGLLALESDLVLFLDGAWAALPPAARSLRGAFRTTDPSAEATVAAVAAAAGALETLDLRLLGGRFDNEPLRFTDWDLKCLLRGLPKLRVLRLPHTRCSEAMLQVLAAHLEELSLGTTEVKAASLKSALKLRSLALAAPLRSFAAAFCPQLQRVELESSRGGDLALNLWNCPELQTVRLATGAVTDTSVVGCPKFAGAEGPPTARRPDTAPATGRRNSLPGSKP